MPVEGVHQVEPVAETCCPIFGTNLASGSVLTCSIPVQSNTFAVLRGRTTQSRHEMLSG